MQGVGLKTVAVASGVSHGALSKLIYGDRTRSQAPSKRIRKTTEDAVLAVTPLNAADGARVPAARFHRDVATLVERGWTKSELARRCGQSPSNFARGGAFVKKANADTIHALLDEPVPPRRSRWGLHAVDQPDPEAERVEAARRAAEAERRAAYRRDPNEDNPMVKLWEATGQTWRTRSACRHVPVEDRWIFWADQYDRQAITAAKAVCATCPVADACLDAAIVGEEHGVWGGTTGSERRQIRRTA